MIDTTKIKRARYMNSSRTLIYVELETEDGTLSKLQFQAPPNNQLGVNPLFDRVVNEIGLEKMSSDFREVELQAHKRNQFEAQKRQSQFERQKMTALLEKKAQAFENPIVEALDSRLLRTSIRKAQSEQQIQSLIIAALVTFVVDNKLNLEDTIKLVNGESISLPMETHTFFDKNSVQESSE